MRLPKFEYIEAASVQEASSILAGAPSTRALAGGTELLVNMKHRVETPPSLVNLKRIAGLDDIVQEDGEIRIGALTRLKKVYQHPLVAEKLPVLAQAALSVGSYHHQAMGTIGGNLCQQTRCKYFNQSKWWRSARPTCFKAGGDACHVVNQNQVCYSTYCGDVAPALLVLEAVVDITGPDGTRAAPVADIYSGQGCAPLTLAPGEIITGIRVPLSVADGFSRYKKIANRESIDFPIVGAAFWASADRSRFRVAYTGVDRRPVRAIEAEERLNQGGLSPEVVEEAVGLVKKTGQPTKSSLYSPSFKRKLMGILLETAVREAREA